MGTYSLRQPECWQVNVSSTSFQITVGGGGGPLQPSAAQDNKSRYEVPPRFRRNNQAPAAQQTQPSQQKIEAIQPQQRQPKHHQPHQQTHQPTQRVPAKPHQQQQRTLVPLPQASSSTEVQAYVHQILTKHSNGLWSNSLARLYEEQSGEKPPANLLQLVENWPDSVSVEGVQGSDRKILYPVAQPCMTVTQSQTPTAVLIKPAALPNIGTKLTGYTCFVRNPSHFYIQRSDTRIEELQAVLEDTYNARGSPKELTDAKPGDFCVSKFENVAWYRAKILNTALKDTQRIYDVFYVDYGNEETVASMRVKRLLPAYAELSSQALKCSMAHVYPQGEEWTNEDVEAFSRIYDFTTELLIKVEQVEGDTCVVTLYDAQDMNICLNDVMVQKGIAVSQPMPCEPSTIRLPEDDEWEVFVSCVLSGCDVTIRIIGTEYSEKLDELEDQLKELEKQSLGKPPHVDQPIAVRMRENEDVTWHRCRVLEPVIGSKVKVTYLDHGDSETVPLADVRNLPKKYNQLPYQAVTCRLSGLEPFANDDRLLNELNKSVLGKPLWCEVNDRHEVLKVTLVDTSSEGDVNINTSIARVLHAEDLTPRLPEENGTVDGFVSHVGEQGKIFFSISGPGMPKLDELHEQMEQKYSQIDPSLMLLQPEVGSVCVAKYSAVGEEGWYRALIHNLYPSMRKAAVYFVDYGNSEIVSYANLRKYSSDVLLLEMLPFQAIEVELSGLPPVGGQWSDEVYERIRDICPPNQVRTLEVISAAEGGCAQVEIHKQDETGELIAVSEILLNEGLFYKEENQQDEVTPAQIPLEELAITSSVKPIKSSQLSPPRKSPPRPTQNLYVPPGQISEDKDFETDHAREKKSPSPFAERFALAQKNRQGTSPLKVDVDAAQRYGRGQGDANSPGAVLGKASPSSIATSSSLPSPGSPLDWGAAVPTPELRTPESWLGDSFHELHHRSPTTPPSPSRPKTPPSPTTSGRWAGATNPGSPSRRNSKKTRSPDQLPYSPTSPTDNRQVLQYEDMMSDYAEPQPEELYQHSNDSSLSEHEVIFISSDEAELEDDTTQFIQNRVMLSLGAEGDGVDNDESDFEEDGALDLCVKQETVPTFTSSPKHVSPGGDKPIKGILKKTRSEDSMGSGSLEINVVGGDDLLSDDDETAPENVPLVDSSDEEEEDANPTKPLKKNVSFSEPLTEAFEEFSIDRTLPIPSEAEKPKSGDEVFVTWVENPHNFRCIPQSSVELIRDQTDAMMVFYNQFGDDHKVRADTVESGHLYASFHVDLWYRVLVKRVIFNQVAIHFVDFGDFSVLPISSLRTLIIDFRKLPFQAIKAKLSGVEPLDELWEEDACARCSELINERTLTAFVHATSEDDEYLNLTLVDTEKSGEEQFIHKVMIQEGLAKKSAMW